MCSAISIYGMIDGDDRRYKVVGRVVEVSGGSEGASRGVR